VVIVFLLFPKCAGAACAVPDLYLSIGFIRKPLRTFRSDANERQIFVSRMPISQNRCALGDMQEGTRP
jgi:hypothetical protein